MSQLNIKGLVENIRTRTNIYTPIIEAIANSIEAIEDSKRKDSVITITIERDTQGTLNLEEEDILPDIRSIYIEDNGIGFTQKNRDSFNTLYGDLKIKSGGKGFGRFIFLKYFNSVSVESNFKEGKDYFKRSFNFGSDKEIIENELCVKSTLSSSSTIVSLKDIKDNKLEKKLETIARKILEKLLIYFIDDDYKCPKIVIKEIGKKEEIILNDYLSNKEDAGIKMIHSEDFNLKKNSEVEKFRTKIFKIYYPSHQRSKISLSAHNREVTDTVLHKYIPEFEDDFFDEFIDNKGEKTRKDFIIKAYVLGQYLDENVSSERSDFKFPSQGDLFFPLGQEDIECKVAEIVRTIFPEEVKKRQDKKFEHITQYVNEKAPWSKIYLKDLDLSLIPFKLDDEIIEVELHKAKFAKEKKTRAQVKNILDGSTIEITESVEKLLEQISDVEMGELAHYVAWRKVILDLFKKSLELKEDGKYNLEDVVHNIIFPTKSNSDQTPYNSHNLWIIDEKLNFTDYISSDEPLNGKTTERVDLLIFNKKMAFRGGNDPGNPITIFEFKRPQRDDFVNESSTEDPVDQVIRYVNAIKDGKYLTPKGRNISIAENTPFYGFIICDLTQKVKDWLLREKDFKLMPDNMGWYRWFSNNNLYIEVIGWDKVLRDAEKRNKIFFNKLGIE